MPLRTREPAWKGYRENFSPSSEMFTSSLKARELPLVKMAAQRQLPSSSAVDENFLVHFWWPGNVDTVLEVLKKVTSSLEQLQNFVSTPGNLGVLWNLVHWDIADDFSYDHIGFCVFLFVGFLK